MQYVLKAHSYIGGRIVYVEAKNEKHLQAYYENNGFICCVDDEENPIKNTSGLLTYLQILPIGI